MHRFFVDPQCIQVGQAVVDGPVARQAAQVLRLRPGDPVVLLDNLGCEYVVTLHTVSPSRLSGEVVEKRRGPGEPGLALTLYQGVLKRDKFEMALQKGAEIGISTFVPVLCRRSIPRASEGWADGRYSRWNSILKEAAEQCGRTRIPLLRPLASLREVLDTAPGVRLMAWEGERERGFREALMERLETARTEGVSILVGPEGGFEPEEVEEAREAGVTPVSLGYRTLRAETAGLVMAVAAMYQVGELGR